MSTYTIVTTTATQGRDELELDVHIDEFDNDSEVVGYSRRVAEEMFSLADQLSLDFDYSNVSLYDVAVGDEDLDVNHSAFFGMWFFADDGVSYATAEALREADHDESSSAPAAPPAGQ